VNPSVTTTINAARADESGNSAILAPATNSAEVRPRSSEQSCVRAVTATIYAFDPTLGRSLSQDQEQERGTAPNPSSLEVAQARD
jgi:hypothetical protein